MNGIQMREHVGPYRIGGRGRDDEADLTNYAARDDDPALVAVEGETVDVGSGRRVADCIVVHGAFS